MMKQIYNKVKRQADLWDDLKYILENGKWSDDTTIGEVLIQMSNMEHQSEKCPRESLARYIQKFVFDELGINVSTLTIKKWMDNGATDKSEIYRFSGDIHSDAQEICDQSRPDVNVSTSP